MDPIYLEYLFKELQEDRLIFVGTKGYTVDDVLYITYIFFDTEEDKTFTVDATPAY